MFCSNCGNSLSENKGSFCPNCGNPTKAQTPASAAAVATTKTISIKAIIIISLSITIIAAISITAFLMLGNRTELQGTWDLVYGSTIQTIDIEGYGDSIPIRTLTFRGNYFEANAYASMLYSGQYGWLLFLLGPVMSGTPGFPEWSYGQGLPYGRVEHRVVYQNPDVYKFSHLSRSGTFSISDNTIELILNDGIIQVFTFESTQDTLIFGNHTFRRR